MVIRNKNYDILVSAINNKTMLWVIMNVKNNKFKRLNIYI